MPYRKLSGSHENMCKISYWVYVLTILFCSLPFQSCQSVDKEKVKKTVETFFNAYRSEDVTAAKTIYPNIGDLRGQFRKSSSIDLDIKDIWVISDSNIIVNLTHHWVNPFGADNTVDMRLYMAKKGNTYEIKDSKKFCIYDELNLYTFACHVGAIKANSDTTDLRIAKGIVNAENMFYSAKAKIKDEIREGLSVTWNWNTGYYSDYASGRAVVTNNTLYPIKQPEYTVTYYKSDGNTVVTSDNGTVCYDVLMPNQSKSFSWYTSYISNASKAGVTVDCSDSWLEEIAVHLPFRGYEYDNYRLNKNWWPL